MSNTTKKLESDHEFKKNFIKLLGSPKFLTILNESELNPLMFNKLFTCHISTIIFESTGIKKANLTVMYKYQYESNSSNTTDKLTSHFLTDLSYSIFSTQYGLIQNTLSQTTRSSIKVKSKHLEYNYKSPISLRTFLEEYKKHLKQIPEEVINNNYDKYIFNSSFKKDNSKYKYEIYYNELTSKHLFLEPFLMNYFLNKKLYLNEEQIQTKGLIKRNKI